MDASHRTAAAAAVSTSTAAGSAPSTASNGHVATTAASSGQGASSVVQLELTAAGSVPAADSPSPLPSELGSAVVERRLRLTLDITDREVIEELSRHSEGPARDAYALAALRLGVTSLKLASGQLDASVVKEAGKELIHEMQSLLSERATRLTSDVASTLTQYFDPKTGALSSRLQSLVQKDGELEQLMRSHLGPEDSLLARSMAAHLGEGSPVFRMLSPTEQNGIRAQLQRTLEQALAEQREAVLREFSLDTKESALSRLVGELGAQASSLGDNLKSQVEVAVKEFSLDKPDSALSRLVSKVDAAQKSIVDQFSSDNADSALNKLSRLLESTSEQIGLNLTLDNEQSALSRLKREIQKPIDELVKRNEEFQARVHETLATFQARKEEAERGAQHGRDFEQRLVELLTSEAQKQGDIGEATGNTTGTIRNCKKGDFVVTLGKECQGAGARLVFEAKEDQSCNLARALAEMDEARKNRGAQLGIFVFSKKTAPEGTAPFWRHGEDLVVVWDADDPATDVYVRAAYSCARALTMRQATKSKEGMKVLSELEGATRAIEKQAGHLDELKTAAETSRNGALKIIDRVEKMRRELDREIERLDESLEALRQSEAGS